MRLRDLREDVHRSLRLLEYSSYLVAMLVICAEMKRLYDDSTSAQGRHLMAETLETLKRVNCSGQREGNLSDIRHLAERWQSLIEAEQDLPSSTTGLINTWFTFDALVHEVLADAPQYTASERVVIPFEQYVAATRESKSGNVGFRRVDINREVGSDEPLMQILRKLQRVPELIEGQNSDAVEMDIERVRSEIFD